MVDVAISFTSVGMPMQH